MFKRVMVLLVGVVFAFSLTGCATSRKKNAELEIQGLKNQVSALESQVQTKDQEIDSLKDSLSRAQEQKESHNFVGKKTVLSRVKSRPNNKQIQIALSNAGYYSGVIDGKIGKQTRASIRAFQKDNGLPVDGKVGKRTWEALRKFLVQRVK